MENEVERISHTTYVDFYLDFHTAKKFPGQRFGQAFLNTIYPEITDSELFYEKSTDKAVEIIFLKYVDLGLSWDSGRKYTGRSLFVEEGE